jgi:iron complex outermembrane receptor protein
VGNNALGGVAWSGGKVINRSQAVFVHGVYDLSDYVEGLRLTAGYRYTWDYVADEGFATSDVPYVTRNAAGAPTNCLNTLGVDKNCYSSVGQNFSSFGWNAGLDEQLTPDILVYVRAGNAYRPGGINLNVPLQFSHFQPEHVTDVEIGEKAEFALWGMKSRVNADIYHTDYKSIQENQLFTTTLSNGNLFTSGGIVNAAAATVNGAEFKADFLPTDDITISPHFSYTDGHYNSFPPGISASTNPPFTNPRIQYGVTTSYHIPMDSSLGSVNVAATYSWIGSQPYDTGLAPAPGFTTLPSYGVLDLRIDWTNVLDRPVDLAFFMTNALDKTYAIGGIPEYSQLGIDTITYGEPRMFGFSVKYRFGGPSEDTPEPAAYTPPPVVAPAPAAAPKSYLVFFDFNKSDLTPQAQTIVDQAAHNAAPAKVTQLTVTGHTDTVGSDAYNMRLSRRRAESVAARLEKDGIPSSEVEIVAKGKRDLLVPTADGVKEPQNRRVQIVYSDGAAS